MIPKTLSGPAGEITQLLKQLGKGGRDVESRLMPLVYAEMRKVAARQMGRERLDHTLQPTALVHEAYLRIFKSSHLDVRNRAHFFAVAARVMRQILVDHAREQKAAKRGGNWHRLDLEDVALTSGEDSARVVDILALDGALRRLEATAPRAARVVELLFFAGMSTEDAALVLGASERTVKRDWSAAKAWLHKEIYGSPAEMAKA